MSQMLTIDIPADMWLSANQRLHWRPKSERTKALRTIGRANARTAQIGPYRVVHVTAFIGYPTARASDPGNAAPTIKALMDGFTDAGVWPDDDGAHVLGPDYRPDGKTGTGMYRVRFVFTNQVVAFGGET